MSRLIRPKILPILTRERHRERDGQGMNALKTDAMAINRSDVQGHRHRVISSGHIPFPIAMDNSDWAIHDSNLAARWRMLADFDYICPPVK